MNTDKLKAILNEGITIQMSAMEWLSVHGNTCLGLRHPANQGRPSRKLAEGFLELIEKELLRRGILSLEDIKEIHKVEREESPHEIY